MSNSCKDTTVVSEKNNTSEAAQKPVNSQFHNNKQTPAVKDATKIAPEAYRSALRPTEKITLGHVYTDTVKFISHNDDYDYRLFIAHKNQDTVSLIHNNDSIYNFVKGDVFKITWKTDRLIHAGDTELVDFSEFLMSFKKIDAFKLVDANNNILWRENVYDESLETDVNTLIFNTTYIKNITEPERAALAYVATFIGNECDWDGKANSDRSNLNCKILTQLHLGYQCSDKHLFFLRKWFENDPQTLKTLETCMTMPYTATVQTTFDNITVITKAEEQRIQIKYQVTGVNMRENAVWNYRQTDTFQYHSGHLILIDSEKIELVN